MKSGLIRASISIAMIVALFFLVDFHDLLRSITAFHPLSGAVALVLVSAQNDLSARRWGVMLRAFGSTVGHFQVLKIQYAAIFAQLFLPTAVGGAAVRTGMAYKVGVSLGVAVNSVVFDRVVAMAGLVLLGALFMPFAAISITDLQEILKLVGVAAAALMVAILAACGARRWRPASWWWGILCRTPLRHLLMPLQSAAVNLRKPSTVTAALACSIGGQIAAIAAVFSLAKGAGLPISFIDCLLVMPPVMFVSALPISVAGWGVREGVMVLAFGMLGVDREPALALSIQAALAGYVAATPGALVWLIEVNRVLYRRRSGNSKR